jgi:heme oxygenase
VTGGALLALRHGTRTEHERLEARLDLLSPSLTRSRYLAVLERFLGVVAPLEARLDGAPVPVDDWPSRRKAHLLADDLGRDAVEVCDDLPDVTTPDLALGCLYVLEGSTLGGREVAAAVEYRLGADVPTSYFRSYGPEVPARWSSFRGAVAARAEAGGDVGAMVDGARRTFEVFERWLVR